jgi:hypothetical protein
MRIAGKKTDYNMKKTKLSILILLLSVLPSLSWSQENVYEEGLISRFKPGFMWYNTGLRPAETEKVRKYDRLMVDINYNTWSSAEIKAFENHWSSISSSVQWMFDIPLAKHNTVSFGWGLGYKRTRIRFDDFLIRDEALSSTSYFENVGNVIEQTHFNANELFIPIELRVRTKGWKHVKFHLGGQIGYQFRASTRYVSASPTSIQTSTTTRGFYDLNPLSARVHARVGIRNWGVFASYNVLPYFTSKESTQLKGLSVGISISLF